MQNYHSLLALCLHLRLPLRLWCFFRFGEFRLFAQLRCRHEEEISKGCHHDHQKGKKNFRTDWQFLEERRFSDCTFLLAFGSHFTLLSLGFLLVALFAGFSFHLFLLS